MDIRLHMAFRMNPKIVELEALLGEGGVLAIITLWAWAAEHRPKGKLTGLSDGALEKFAMWRGTSGLFIDTCLKQRLLERDAEGVIEIHDWKEHQPWAFFSKERKKIAARNGAAKWRTASAVAGKANRAERMKRARAKGTHTKAEWESLVNALKSRCVRCNAECLPVKDHITPVYQGGSDGIENLQPLCAPCNGAKGPENKDFRPANWRELMSAMMPANGRRQSGNDACKMPATTPTPSPSPIPSPSPTPNVLIGAAASPTPPARKPKKELGYNAVAIFCEEYKRRYAVNPNIIDKDAGQLTTLARSYPEDAFRKLCHAYIQDTTDVRVVNDAHPIGLFLTKRSRYQVQIAGGKVLTAQPPRNGFAQPPKVTLTEEERKRRDHAAYLKSLEQL